MTKTNDNFFSTALKQNDLCLAPLAGVTDMPFRSICLDYGVGLMTTEMISAKGLYYNNAATKELTALDSRETQTGIQLFGSDTNALSEAIKRYCNDSAFAFVDLNMGCPVRKVVSNGDGSALLSDERKMAEVAKTVSEASKKPVSAKIRIGIDENRITTRQSVKILQECGIQAIAVHGRTRAQMYSGEANLNEIANAVSISIVPIIGNGDVHDAASYKRMKGTGCDGVMIGRAAMGNPFIFREIRAELQSGMHHLTDNGEKLEVAKKHFVMLVQFKGEHLACAEFRKHLAWYTKGMPHSAKLRQEIYRIESSENMLAFIDRYQKELTEIKGDCQ